MSKRLGGIKGCKYKTSSWHLNRFPDADNIMTLGTQYNVCVCVCVFSSHSFWTLSSLDVPAGVTQEEGHTGFLIHLLSAVRALIFLARRIQPFLSLVNREVEFCVLTIQSFSTRWAFLFLFLFFSEKNPVCRDRTHIPTCQRVTRYL